MRATAILNFSSKLAIISIGVDRLLVIEFQEFLYLLDIVSTKEMLIKATIATTKLTLDATAETEVGIEMRRIDVDLAIGEDGSAISAFLA